MFPKYITHYSLLHIAYWECPTGQLYLWTQLDHGTCWDAGWGHLGSGMQPFQVQ